MYKNVLFVCWLGHVSELAETNSQKFQVSQKWMLIKFSELYLLNVRLVGTLLDRILDAVTFGPPDLWDLISRGPPDFCKLGSSWIP